MIETPQADRERRIRAYAHALWRAEGRAEEHWFKGRDAVTNEAVPAEAPAEIDETAAAKPYLYVPPAGHGL